MILPDTEIQYLCEQYEMVVPFTSTLLNPSSLDLRLGDNIMVEADHTPEMQMQAIANTTKEKPYLLHPGAFILAETLEIFNMPEDVAGQFVLKSSRAREGLQHMLAGYIDPLFTNSVLTLELKNVRTIHPIPLWRGMKIGQCVFHMLSGTPQQRYDKVGHYCNRLTVVNSWEAQAA